MSGVSIAKRSSSSFILGVAMQSDLQLPSDCNFRSNDSNYKGGAFPEFFHGHYKGVYGLDAGILYKDNKFYLFIGGLSTTTQTSWYESTAVSISKGETVKLKTYFRSTNEIIVEVYKANGTTLIKSLVGQLKSAAYNSLITGHVINRELNIAINADANGKVNLSPAVYFKSAKFSNSTITERGGNTLPLSAAESSVIYNKWDETPPQSELRYFKSSYNSGSSNSFVWDLTSATLNYLEYDI